MAQFQRDVAKASQPQQGPISPAGAVTGAGLGGGNATAQHGDDILRNNPILEKRWELTKSAWTNQGGPTGPLADLLRRNGIQVVPGVNEPPPNSVSKKSGVPLAEANNKNGELARDAIAERFRAQGLSEVDVEQTHGARRVDVQAKQPHPTDPRFNREIHVESKVGKVGTEHAGQVAKDAEALADRRATRQVGERMGRVGRVLRPVGVVVDAINVGAAYRADGNRVGENTGRAVSGLAGGAAGAWGGAVAGAAIGSVIPVVGTVIGGVIGGILGGMAGDAAGKGVFDAARSKA